MSLSVVISERAEKNLDKIVTYLELEWSERVKQNFINKLFKAVQQIADKPLMYPASEIKKNVRRCVVSKHTTVYYKFSSTELEIITIQDNRQNPAFLKF
jgi:plasmid stabilization system protein ParE